MDEEDENAIDLSNLNDDQLAELWHTAHETLDDVEKELKEDLRYVTATSIIEEIKKIATQRLESSGASSINTPHGTIHTVGKTTARIMDPEEFRGFVIAHNAWDMLDWKANMTACRNWSDETQCPVPGVELTTFRRLSITAPKVAMKRIKDNVE